MVDKSSHGNSSSQVDTKSAKTKLCWNCEGSVSRVAENCPYCGVYLSPDNPSIKETPAASPKPPYSPDNSRKDIPKAPYSPKSAQPQPAAAAPAAKETVSSAKAESFKSIYIPLLLLTAGTVSLFFSFILLLFSTNGKLVLQWDSAYWYIYAIIALPILYLGWRALDSLIEEK